MRSLKTLEDLSTHKISVPKAYALIGAKKQPARFIKLRIQQADKTAQRWLNFLFFWPLPIRPAYFFLKRALPPEERRFFKDLLVFARGIKIDIESAETKISLRIY